MQPQGNNFAREVRPFMNTESDILPLRKSSKGGKSENDFASSMSTKSGAENDSASGSDEGQHGEGELPQPPLKSCATALWRTRMCKHFVNGGCRYGDKCGFSHSDDLNQRPDLLKTRLCSRFQKGSCKKGGNCKFAHGLAELKAIQAPQNMPESLKLKSNKVKNQQGTTETHPKKAAKEVTPQDMEPMKCELQPMKCGLQPMKCPLPSTMVPHPVSGGYRAPEPRFEMMGGHRVLEPQFTAVPPEVVPPTRLQQSVRQPQNTKNGWPEANAVMPDHQYMALLECKRLRQSLMLEEVDSHVIDSKEQHLLGTSLVNNLQGENWGAQNQVVNQPCDTWRPQNQMSFVGQSRMERESVFANIWSDN